MCSIMDTPTNQDIIIMAQRARTQELPIRHVGFFYKAGAKGSGLEVLTGHLSGIHGGPVLPLEFGLHAISDAVMKDYDDAARTEAPGFVVQVCFGQLERMVTQNRSQGGITMEDVALFCANVAWLASRGHLKNDEFNGTSFMRF